MQSHCPMSTEITSICAGLYRRRGDGDAGRFVSRQRPTSPCLPGYGPGREPSDRPQVPPGEQTSMRASMDA